MTNVVLIAENLLLKQMQNGLAKEKGINILCAVDNPRELLEFLAVQRDVVCILDIPAEQAEKLLPILKERSIPAVAIVERADAGFNLMQKGALNMLVRRKDSAEFQDEYFFKMLIQRINEAADATGNTPTRTLKRTFSGTISKIILIGSSTGGTEALASILKHMPEDAPPILVVQHMPPVFTRLYAQRLHGLCRVSVWEAADGDKLHNGLVLIAAGDYHMELAKMGDGYSVRCHQDEKVLSQRPSVDVLFQSAARTLGAAVKNTLGIILTGMGTDGAVGLQALRELGAATVGQDKDSSVVYGMPKAAFECGAVQYQLPLDEIAPFVLDWV